MRVSVIVPNHNYGSFIGETVRSLLSQSMPSREYEVLVIDDGSQDISRRILEPYLDSIRLFTGANQGHLAACNEGFRRAKGQYVVRVDADDYVNSDFLKLEALYLEENKGYDAASCDYYKVDVLGNRLGRCFAAKEPIACGVMFRREKVLQEGCYRDSMDIWEDTYFVERFLQKYPVINIPLPLYRYRQHEGSLTSK